MGETSLYIISEIEEVGIQSFFKVGTTKNSTKRLCHLQLANPRQLKISFTSEPLNKKDAVILEKFIHRSLKRKHIRGEWFKGNLKASIRQIKNLIKEFNSNLNKYRRLCKKEKWKSQRGYLPYGQNPNELALIDRFQELRNNEGRRKLSYAKVAEQLDKEGFKTRKGTKILYQQLQRINAKIK